MPFGVRIFETLRNFIYRYVELSNQSAIAGISNRDSDNLELTKQRAAREQREEHKQ